MIILYRGDSTNIREFEFTKTRAGCYYGQGVYMTDDRTVAETYKQKEVPARYSHKLSNVLFDSHANSLIEARTIALNNLRDRIDPHGNLLVGKWTGKITAKHKAMIERRIFELEPELKIKFLGLTTKIPVTVNGQKFIKFLAKSEKNSHYTVTLPQLPSVGKISVFHFPSRDFLHNIIDVETTIRDSEIARLLLVTIKQSDKSKNKLADYLGKMYWLQPRKEIRKEIPLENLIAQVSIAQLRRLDMINLNGIRKVLSPYGYLGLHYYGGFSSGGARHNAYVLWDDAYINAHRIS